MEITTINCKIITPILMHGENTAIAELRPPAIKGAMRFWWRAIHVNLSLKDLKEQESILFGGAGDGNAIRSSFRIKLLKKHLITTQVNPLPHRQNSQFKINGYQENQNFVLEFIGKDVKKIEKIFELTTILCGFGQRSRRGFGSVEINNQNSITVEYIQNLIQEINQNSQNNSNNNYPYIRTIDLGRDYSDMKSLIRTISTATHNHNGDGMFGSVNGRYASPVYISIIKNAHNYQPIITTLNATKTIDDDRLQEFKEAIL